MKRIKQINESKERISKALIDLLREHKFEDINITDITLTAEVTRMTFYRHFKNKNDIIKYILHNIQKTIADEISKMKNPSLSDLIRLRFRVLKESPWINVLQSDKNIEQLLNDFKLQNIDSFNDILPNTGDKYTQAFYMGGVDSVTMKWIQNGMKESSQEITEKIISLL